MRLIYRIILLALVGLVVVGCGENMIQREIEKSVAASMPGTIGPADKYVVKASGSTMMMIKGKLDALEIVGTNVRLAAGVTASKLIVNISDITVNTNTKAVKKVGSTKYSVTISQSELSRYAASKLPEYPGLKIELRQGLVGVSAKPGISRLRMGILASAAVEVRKQRILALDLKTLKVAGINAPGFAREFADSKLDTLFDANDLGCDAKIKSAMVTPGSLTLVGELDLIKLTKKASGG